MQSSYDDFDWSFGKNCTKTKETGPCNDVDLNNKGEFLRISLVSIYHTSEWCFSRALIG